MAVTYRWGDSAHRIVLASDGRTIPADSGNADYAQLLATGAAIAEAEAPTPTLSDYQAALDRHLADIATAHGYTSESIFASYVSSTNATWAAEAQAFVAARDAMWEQSAMLLTAVQEGRAVAPSVSEYLAQLPRF